MREEKSRKKRSYWYNRILAGLLFFSLLLSGCSGGRTGEAQNGSETDSGSAGVSQKEVSYSKGSTGEGDLSVQVLDVGQGSATLIRQGDAALLMDGGDADYSSYVVSLLKKEGIDHLDLVVISHYDSDHLSGIVGVLNAFSCDLVLSPDYTTDTRTYQSFLSVIEKKNITQEHPKIGDTYAFAESTIRIVAPVSYTYEDSNSNSIGIRVSYGDNSVLICGDATKETEEDLLYRNVDVASDVYIANHHGSKYSNSDAFLSAVSPDYVIISCGRDNSYGHPSASVMLAFQKLGAALYRTDLQGEIDFCCDGTEITFAKEACTDYRSGEEVAQADQSQTADQSDTSTIKTEGSDDSGEQTESTDQTDKTESAEDGFALNTKTKKFHRPDCASVQKINSENKAVSTETRDSLIRQGYAPCGNCNP